MLYNIIYDIKDKQREDSFVAALKGMGESILSFVGCWFIDTEKQKNDIYNILKPLTDNADLFYISKVKLKDMSGWLPSNTVSWLTNHPE